MPLPSPLGCTDPEWIRRQRRGRHVHQNGRMQWLPEAKTGGQGKSFHAMWLHQGRLPDCLRQETAIESSDRGNAAKRSMSKCKPSCDTVSRGVYLLFAWKGCSVELHTRAGCVPRSVVRAHVTCRAWHDTIRYLYSQSIFSRLVFLLYY